MTNRVTVKPNGPLIFQGRIRLENAEGATLAEDSEMVLCRCGQSSNKPFCDGSHQTHDFVDAALFHDEKTEPSEGEDELVITVRSNAMLIAKGPMLISNIDGSATTSRNKAALCRCGYSSNKPFCDASHKKWGFTD